MPDLLSDLLEIVEGLPLDDVTKANFVQRITRLGLGAPQAAGGSRYAELSARLLARYPAPAGPGGPKPPPPPPAQDDPDGFASGLDDEGDDTERGTRRSPCA